MSTEGTGFGQLQSVAGLMILVGAGISLVFEELAWIGIAIGVTALIVSLALLFIQARDKR